MLRRSASLPLLVQLALPLVAFLVATGLAAAVGVDGLGRAATVGSLVFAVVLVAVLLRGSSRGT